MPKVAKQLPEPTNAALLAELRLLRSALASLDARVTTLYRWCELAVNRPWELKAKPSPESLQDSEIPF